MSFDPWSDKKLPDLVATGRGGGFEDNFYCPLPDSDQYLALLERKLAKLGKSKSSENRQLLESLEERKTDTVVRLLTESDQSLPEYFSDEDIPTKWLRSYLNPEQPLTVGELLSLVKEDYLAKSSEDTESKEVEND